MTGQDEMRTLVQTTRTYVHRLGQHADEDVTLGQILTAALAARGSGISADSSFEIRWDSSTQERVVRFVHVTVTEQ